MPLAAVLWCNMSSCPCRPWQTTFFLRTWEHNSTCKLVPKRLKVLDCDITSGQAMQVHGHGDHGRFCSCVHLAWKSNLMLWAHARKAQSLGLWRYIWAGCAGSCPWRPWQTITRSGPSGDDSPTLLGASGRATTTSGSRLAMSSSSLASSCSTGQPRPSSRIRCPFSRLSSSWCENPPFAPSCREQACACMFGEQSHNVALLCRLPHGAY